jgi:hypothetical protein
MINSEAREGNALREIIMNFVSGLTNEDSRNAPVFCLLIY